jgi:hypothetical protein
MRAKPTIATPTSGDGQDERAEAADRRNGGTAWAASVWRSPVSSIVAHRPCARVPVLMRATWAAAPRPLTRGSTAAGISTANPLPRRHGERADGFPEDGALLGLFREYLRTGLIGAQRCGATWRAAAVRAVQHQELEI